jgi:hypothetical protein
MITTATDGVFVFTFWPPPPFQFTVDVRQDGRGTMGGRWSTIAEGATKDVGDVRMGPGVLVQGRVVDDTGAPCEKEYVTLQREATGGSRGNMEPSWGEQTISKADGGFALRSWLEPGEYAVSTQKGELQSPKKVQLVPLSVPAARSAVTVSAQESSALRWVHTPSARPNMSSTMMSFVITFLMIMPITSDSTTNPIATTIARFLAAWRSMASMPERYALALPA